MANEHFFDESQFNITLHRVFILLKDNYGRRTANVFRNRLLANQIDTWSRFVNMPYEKFVEIFKTKEFRARILKAVRTVYARGPITRESTRAAGYNDLHFNGHDIFEETFKFTPNKGIPVYNYTKVPRYYRTKKVIR